MMSNEELFIILAARKLAGEASAAELQQLDELLQQHEVLQSRYLLMQQYFRESAQHTPADTELALQRTLQKLRRPEEAPLNQRNRWWKWTAAAAALAGIAVALTVFWPGRHAGTGQTASAASDTALWLKRENGKATRAVIELADGSKIWLNADSKLTYPEVFGKASREVYLSGEAFFNVAGSADRPFIVHLAKGMVKVLGTSFNVRAYDDEPVQTSVTTGKVAFIPKYEDADHLPDTFYITPDEKVTFRHTVDNIVKEATSGADDKAWTEGRLVFRDVSLEDICRELERTFGKKVTFNSDKPRQYRMTGAFQDNNLQEIMYYLAKSKSFKYTITDSLLLISE